MTRIPSWSMRFALGLSSVFTIGALSAGGISYVLQTRELSARLAADVQSIALGLAQIAEDGDRQDLREQVQAQALSSHDGSTLVAWIDAETGEVVGNFRPRVPFVGARRLDPLQDLLLTDPTAVEIPDAYEAYGVKTPLGTVMAARDTVWITESGEILMQSTIWGLGAALALSISLAIAIARRNERRIQAMEEVLEEVGRGRMDLRISDAHEDDLARLANGVNATLDRLEAGVSAIKQVSTDVAHDLRAPLGRLRLKLEPYATDPSLPAALRYVFGTTLADIDGISGTFDSILRLASLQSGSIDLQREKIDTGALVRDVFEIMEPIAEDAGHKMTLIAPPDGSFLSGDSELLTQALINLADNAIRHCRAPAAIVIGAATNHGITTLWVADNGPGIAPEDRTKVLERFVRLDNSRTTPGTGLGLSMVSAIAALHNAALTLDGTNPGLRVTLAFHRDTEAKFNDP